MKNNKGFTMVEALAALVIISILLLVLTRGITAASNWFAEGERIKNEGSAVADEVDGSHSGTVTKTQESGDGMGLKSESGGNLAMKNDATIVNKYSFKDSDVFMKDMDTQVADANMNYYSTEVSHAQTVKKSIENFWSGIFDMSDKERNNLSLAGGNAYNSNMVMQAWLDSGNHFLAVNNSFISEQNVEEGINIGKLYIRGTLYNLNDESRSVLVYASTSNDMTGDMGKAIMIYYNNYWYVAPRGKDSSMNYELLNILENSVLPKVSDVQEDENGINHVTYDTSAEGTKIVNASDVYSYIIMSENGWKKLVYTEE